MTRHMMGGHVAIGPNKYGPISDDQVEQAKKNAGSVFFCTKCLAEFERNGERKEHQRNCDGKESS